MVSTVQEGGALARAGVSPGDSLVAWRFGHHEGCFCSSLDLERVEVESSSSGPSELLVRDGMGAERVVVVSAGWWQVVSASLPTLQRAGHADLYLAGQQHRRAGRFSDAAEVYLEASRIAPPGDLTHVLAGRALALLGAGDAAGAVASAADAVSHAATEVEMARGFLLQARGQAMAGDLAGAWASASMALELQSAADPDTIAAAEILGLLGGLELTAGHAEEGLTRLSRSLEMSARLWPESPLFRSTAVHRARGLLASGRILEATADALAAANSGPKEPLPHDLALLVRGEVGGLQP